mmetsp:Transcript_11142/g.26862  ORF Transcript_11142/g.26862 Transcript_11142/m.26862 type:complete len:192 (-) Transcript_11142:642-1217(-)
MRNISGLEELELGFNRFDEHGVNALNEGLRYNDSISELHFPTQFCGGVIGRSDYRDQYGSPATGLLDLNAAAKIDLSHASKSQIENVAGYLECQRRLNSVTAKNDPDGDLSSLEFHPDSLYHEHEGQVIYKGNYRQQTVRGETVQRVEELMAAAAKAKQVYDALLLSVSSKIGGIDPEKSVKTCPLKADWE